MPDSKELPGDIAYALGRKLTTGIGDMKMAESAVGVKVLASKTFSHTDSIRSGPVTVALHSDWSMTFQRSDGYEIGFEFTLLTIEEDQLLFFNELSNPVSYDRFKYERKHAVDHHTVEFAHFLIEQKLPKSLAVRLAVVSISIDSPEEMWTAYRNLKQAFFYSQKSGQSSFEIYMLMANKFGIPFADSVFRLKALSLESLEQTYESMKSILLHADAKGLIAVSTPESLETFMVIARFMSMRIKQNALVASRLVVDDGTTDWNLVTLLNDRMTKQLSIEDLVAPEDLEFVGHFKTDKTRNFVLSGVSGIPSPGYLITIYALLIAKYGLRPILQAANKLREDQLTDNSFAAFIVITDFIGQTGDTDTNLQWILLLSGDMDEDNFS
jgi:hypothetical protein